MYDLPLSIVLPVRNAAAHLETAVLECLAIAPRWFADFEIIIVDDASDDATPAIAAALACQHEPVQIIHSRRRRGFGAALADGWSVARGGWVLALGPGGTASALPRLAPYAGTHAIVSGYLAQPRAGGSLRLINSALGLDLRAGISPAFLFRADIGDPHQICSAGGLAYAELVARAVRQGARHVQVEVPGAAAARPGIGAAARVGLASAGELLWLRQSLQAAGQPQPAPSWRHKAVFGAVAAAAGGIWILRRHLPWR